MQRVRILTSLGVALLTVGVSVAVSLPSHAAGGLSATYSRVQEWPGSYFQGQYVIANGTSAAVTSWTLTFTLPAGGHHLYAVQLGGRVLQHHEVAREGPQLRLPVPDRQRDG